MKALDLENAVSLGPAGVEIGGAEKTTERQGEHYDLSTGDWTSPIQVRPRKTRLGPKVPKQPERPSPLPTPEMREALRVNWKAAREAAAAMVQAAADQDLPGLGIAADDLDQALAKLWELRSFRDLDWQTILNHVQGMMRQFFARKQVEVLTKEQCQKIWTIIEENLGPATKTVDDLNEVLRLIEDAGFDPFEAISGDVLDKRLE